jgi:hypothetical protein
MQGLLDRTPARGAERGAGGSRNTLAGMDKGRRRW